MNTKLIIYVPKLTKRVQYIFDLMLREYLGIDMEFTTDAEHFTSSPKIKIQYGGQRIDGVVFFGAHSLLFQSGISEQPISHVKYNGITGLFKISDPSSVMPFDPFAASFYMVTRYEEYLPFIEDKYGRFTPQNSIAFELDFLNQPVVNIWALNVLACIRNVFPMLMIHERKYKFIPTFDIDIAYAYRYKGAVRLIAGYIKSLFNLDIDDIKERSRVLLSLDKDPYDTYDLILRLHKKNRADLILFFLYSKYSQYDKNVPIHNRKFQSLIKRMGDYVDIGIHPSFRSNSSISALTEEVSGLSSVLNKNIIKSRQHFLKVTMPDTYRNLIINDIQHDYSMGYASEPGFRAGICIPFLFYDLDNEMVTKLRIHPFTIMDGTLRDYKDTNISQALDIILPLIRQVKQVKGDLYTIWHNESLSDTKRWKGWLFVYEELIKAAKP